MGAPDEGGKVLKLTRILGCDPGITGALALTTAPDQLESVHDMPLSSGNVCPLALKKLLIQLRPDLVVIERAGAPGGRGIKLGVAHGVLLAVVQLLELRVHIVAPIAWKSSLYLTSDKRRSCELAVKLWPEQKALFRRQQDHNRAEAALIALWAWSQSHLVGPTELEAKEPLQPQCCQPKLGDAFQFFEVPLSKLTNAETIRLGFLDELSEPTE
ncbi:MAG: hypothetical protein JWM36_537 [Hyphomicrobiales bacterium]|nr:hypothetical protein [Hyphomicrobiales bacterium]